MLDQIKVIWDSYGEDRMLEAWEELQEEGLSLWKRHTGEVPPGFNQITINGNSYIKQSHVKTGTTIIRPASASLETVPTIMESNNAIFCPICKEQAYPESNCIGCTKFICGSDSDHVFSIWRRRTD